MTLLDSAWPRARVAHVCEMCGRRIDPGEKYQRQGCVYDGRAYTFKCCAHCDALLRLFPDTVENADDGYTAENLWEWEPRTIPAARLRAQVRRRWRNLAGDLYPIPTREAYPAYPLTHGLASTEVDGRRRAVLDTTACGIARTPDLWVAQPWEAPDCPDCRRIYRDRPAHLR